MKELVDANGMKAALGQGRPVMLICCSGALPAELATLVTVQESQPPSPADQQQKNSVAGAETAASIDWVSFDVSKAPTVVDTLGVAQLPAAFAVSATGEFLDKIEGLSALLQDIPTFATKFRESLQPTQLSEGSAMKVDIAKMTAMGHKLMLQGKPEYAEKFFLKALGVIDAVSGDAPATGNQDMDATLALLLSSIIIARCVQGKVAEPSTEAYCKRLVDHFPLQVTEAKSTALRSVVMYDLLRLAPFKYVGDAQVSERKLREALKADKEPNSAACFRLRGQLLVTLFLSEKLEEAFTEGFKLYHSKIPVWVEFGETALDAFVQFLGPEDPLTKASGWRLTPP